MSKPSTLPEFNPSRKSEVDVIKAKTDDLMDYVRSHCPANREASIAITNYEQASMWAVKSLFT